MKYIDNNILRKEIIISFNNNELTNNTQNILSTLIENIMIKYQFNNHNEKTISRWYIKNKLFNKNYWKNLNIDKINEKHLPIHYYSEVIKRLLIQSIKNKIKIERQFFIEERRKERKEKLIEIENKLKLISH